MLVVFKTTSGTIAAALSEVILQLDDKNQTVHLFYDSTDRGVILSFLAENEEAVYNYFEIHQEQLKYV